MWVVSSKDEAYGLVRAANAGIETAVFKMKDFDAPQSAGELLVKSLREREIDFIALAGYLKMVPVEVLRAYPNRVVNIHPALLPAFPGLEAQKQALDYGVKFTGCTVHIVDEGVDTGPIISQAVVPIHDDDTVEALSARVLKEEHRIYSEAIRLLLEDKVRIEGRRAVLRN